MEDLASRIVKKALALGCQDAVADVVTNRSYQIRFARNEPVISNRWRETTASAVLVHSRRVLASDIKDLTRTDEAVERLVKIAKASQENPEYAGIARGPFSYARMAPDKKVLALEDGSDHVDAAIHGALEMGATECAGPFERGPRAGPSGFPVPAHPRPRAPRGERAWDRRGDEALPVRSRPGGS